MSNLANSLIALTIAVERAFAAACHSNGFTSKQGHLLCHLIDGPARMGKLGQLLELEKPGISGLVDRVEKRGLVQRERDPHDRRGCVVALTTQGQHAAHSTHEDVTRRLETLAEHLTDGDRDQLESLLDAVLKPAKLNRA